MKLRHFFEAASTEVAIIFGRFNPPHKGHKAAWELASKSPIWFVGTNESTVGPKDPLPFEVKVEAMKAIWPEVESHIVAETSWLTLASKVYEQYPDATLLCLTDEEWVTKTIVQYNGKEGAHGFYNFKNITQKPTPRLSSATALRDAVTKGDREAFSQAAGVSADTPVAGKPFFDLVAEYLLPYSNAPVKKAVKKKVPAPVEGVTEVSDELRNRYVARASDDYGSANFAARSAKSHPGLDDYSKEQEHRAKKRAAGLGRALSDKRRNKTEGVAEANSPAMAQTAQRLTDPKDGAVAKLRAAGDKRREDHLKSRDIAKKNEGKEANYDSNYQDMVKRVGQKAKEGPRKTVWDPVKRVYKTVPVNPPKTETIKKVGSQYELVSKKGKNLGKYPTKAGAEKREKQVNYFKHVDEDAAGVGIITKQNSTVDVNKSTPRKNLKAFKLVK